MPLPEVGAACSAEFAAFVGACMAKDPFQRPSAEALLGHSWLRKVWGLVSFPCCHLSWGFSRIAG